eukprot:COSAG02_NODE_11717_length_1668_cov_7.739324_1_plen_353_part_00
MDADAALAQQLQSEQDFEAAAAVAAACYHEERPRDRKPACPETGRKAGGVLLVCGHRRHGPCLVVFHNRSKNRDWECPYGTYDGPPKHPTIVDTAAEELWEETCAQISIRPEVLVAIAQRGAASWRGDGMFALRVDGLSRSRFRANRSALRQVRHQLQRDFDGNGCGLGSTLEMDSMTFVPLDHLTHIDLQRPKRADGQRTRVSVADADGETVALSLLADQLRNGGLDLALRAFEAGDVRKLGCDVIDCLDPVQHLRDVGDWRLSGVQTLIVLARTHHHTEAVSAECSGGTAASSESDSVPVKPEQTSDSTATTPAEALCTRQERAAEAAAAAEHRLQLQQQQQQQQQPPPL